MWRRWKRRKKQMSRKEGEDEGDGGWIEGELKYVSARALKSLGELENLGTTRIGLYALVWCTNEQTRAIPSILPSPSTFELIVPSSFLLLPRNTMPLLCESHLHSLTSLLRAHLYP